VKPARIFTIGHSNRTTREFIELIEERKLKLLIDVRTIPKSRHNPQFGQSRLKASLRRHEIEYRHMSGLGGLRKPRKDSPSGAWRNSAFRGFADYMQTEEFEENLDRLISLAKRKRLVLMCAEAVPWRCHRSLIADALVARGLPVAEIISKSPARAHKLTSFARVLKGHVTYPPPATTAATK
jgi:uncharacterized protein (DUF488 family)